MSRTRRMVPGLRDPGRGSRPGSGGEVLPEPDLVRLRVADRGPAAHAGVLARRRDQRTTVRLGRAAGPRMPRFRFPVAGRAAPGQSPDRRRSDRSPTAADRRSAGRRCRRRRTDSRSRAGPAAAVPSPAGTARPPGRADGTPRAGRPERRAAGWWPRTSPALASLASSHGFSASTRRLAAPTNSHSAASASWSRQRSIERPESKQRIGPGIVQRGRGPGPGPLAGQVAVGHRDRAVDRLPKSLARSAL